MVFENLIKKLSSKLLKFSFKNGILLHGGGWKKMEAMKISNKIFKGRLLSKIKLKISKKMIFLKNDFAKKI